MATLEEKYAALKAELGAMGRVGVAFSGGVDSSLLLKVAHDTLGGNAVALSASLRSVPEFERREAAEFCRANSIEQIICEINELELPAFAANLPDRCYHCKLKVLETLKTAAAKRGITQLVEGSNVDDLSDYRPGRRAVIECGVASPLLNAGLTKAEIRELSARLGLSTFDKPAYACLASRIPVGEQITEEKLRRVERAEEYLMSLGIRQMRVRAHNDLARIEVTPESIELLAASPMREELSHRLKALGFRYVSLDLTGYKTGSMNPESV